MMTLLEKYKPLYAPDDGGSGQTIVGESPTPTTTATSTSSDASNPDSGGSSEGSPESTPSGDSLDFMSIFGQPESGLPSGKPEAPSAPPKEKPAAAQPDKPSTPPVQTGEAEKVSVKAEPPQAKPPAAADQGAPVAGQPQAGASTEAPALDPYDPVALASHLESQKAQAVELVAQQMFQLSPEDREAIEQDVIGHIPKLLARVYVESQQGVLNQLGRIIPTMIQRQTEGLRQDKENEGKFFERWKSFGLDSVKHGDIARKYGAVYRQMHPKATLEQMIEDLGPMVMMAAKVIPSVGALGASGQPSAGSAVTPSTTTNGRRPPASPFVPAGGGPASAQRNPEKEAWETIFEHSG